MPRFILFVFSLLWMPALAFAGFEWVPPVERAAPAEVVSENVGSDTMERFPAPAVIAQPLANDTPISIVPNQQNLPRPPQQDGSVAIPSNVVVTVPDMPVADTSSQNFIPKKPKTSSGGKLVIDPYPLRGGASAPSSQLAMSDTYRAMGEEARILNPVRLGSGLSTGVGRQKKAYVSRPIKSVSIAPKTPFITNSGITPMIGGEPAPLPGVATPRAPMPLKSHASKTYAQAIGFGRDLPLALAMSQVIPSEFTHSFADNVDTGITVSWEGGKPWNQVLNNMLRPKNLTSVIRNNRVIIQPMAKL